MGEYKYKAFISYSHKDRKWTRWLHRRLETYPIPKNIIGNTTSAGIIPRRLKPIFRDREELSASNNLGEKIQAALASSKNLIIICSPAAAKSKWVNQEILTFKQNNRDAQLFSVIVEGEPYASTMPGREAEECFPPALRFEVNEDGTLSDTPAEPLAADLRPHADGKRLGFLKLISGMIGVGLDDVVQRDMKRSRKRVTAITTASLATVLAMGTLTGFALDARAEAEIAQAEAEAGRNDAEESIEFMLTDLKSELEKVGRLDALKIVGKRAETYYGKYQITQHNDEALGRRARVFHFLGEVLSKEGELETANKYFGNAYIATKALLDRNPKSSDRVFEHAQSAYWVGHIPWKTGNHDDARPFFDEYIALAENLHQLAPNDSRGLQEITYAYTNLGVFLDQQSDFSSSYNLFLKALPAYKKLSLEGDAGLNRQLDLANIYGWLADAALKNLQLDSAYDYRIVQNNLLQEHLVENSSNFKLIKYRLAAITQLAKLSKMRGNYSESKEWLSEGLTLSTILTNQDAKNLEYLRSHLYMQILKVEELLEEGNFLESKKLIQHINQQEQGYRKVNPNDKRLLENVTFPRNLMTIILNLREGDSLAATYNINDFSEYLQELIDTNASTNSVRKAYCKLAFLEFLKTKNEADALHKIEEFKVEHDLEIMWIYINLKQKSENEITDENLKGDGKFRFNRKILGKFGTKI